MPAIPRALARHHDSVDNQTAMLDHGILLNVRQVEEPSGPLPPVSPISESSCSGWGCLTEAQQAGIIVTIVVVSTVLILAMLFFFRSKKEGDWIDEDFVLVRQSRRPRTSTQARNFQRSQFFFRHEGLATSQQLPQFIITYPKIIHIPPPPPPPIPVPLPMPLPPPIPFTQPQPIYPMVYEPHYRNLTRCHSFFHRQGHYAAPVFPINTSTKQTSKSSKARHTHKARQAAHRSWTAGRGHQDTQQPPQRINSLARRLFGIFNPPVGRASTIASSDSSSTRTPSIRDSRNSRASATTISTQSSSETRKRGDLSPKRAHTRVNDSSPTTETIGAANLSVPTDQRHANATRHKAEPGPSTKRIPIDDTVHIAGREANGLRRSTLEGQNSNEHVAEQGHAIPVSIFQPSTKTEVRSIPRDIKPIRSALKNGRSAIEATQRNSMSAQNEPPTRMAKTNIVNAENPLSRTANMIETETDPLAKTSPRLGHRKKVSKRRGHKDEKAETTKNSHQSFLDTTIRPAEIINETPTADSNRPVGSSEMTERHNTKAAHHLQETLRRAQEFQFLLPDNVEIVEDLSSYSPPPSPPRPIHQGGGQYAPEQLRNRPRRRMH
ncbi:hypothetical protein CSUB01_05229 [Colletotrichum sublineola]|uniref:Uncharacterized protein n=1 Tax=Colletotrichum sublineola TaxID=1173701 RepID=A0A066XD93_COLSU|nr:hypothetical protein CSUB01_05229 [Colletotrichum sublineola]